ncbi:MAG: type II toxin-antitoxin system HipA family toxin [Deltaproteobacteria bacterium]|nr:type II toxin-antitoxin system HipA family toxin [Deltaproteobacteria bacterium]
MTSDTQPSECFVYITLPGQTSPVTAGRFELTSNRSGVALGRFVYGKRYLNNPDAVEFDPVELKLAARTYETTALKGVFGALRDAGPDYWGRRVIERNAGKAPLGEMDYLLHSPDDRAGALGFGLSQTPTAPRRRFNQTLDLEKLQKIADAIVADEELPTDAATGQIEELMLIGTSMGGARPKTVVEDHDGLWLAKFNRPDDKWNHARVEHAMHLLARSCGITTAESRVVSIGGRDVLLVKRFDREKTKQGYLRARMVSGLTLLLAEDSHLARDKWSYVLLAEELRRVSAQPQADAAELFRRMCFNALISNIDDHPRNHAVIAKNREWKLSPAYDLTPSTPISLERRDLALAAGDAGRFANAENVLSQCLRFLLRRDEAEALVKEMEKSVKSTWYQVARGAGVCEADCGLISGAFAYPGFASERSKSE